MNKPLVGQTCTFYPGQHHVKDLTPVRGAVGKVWSETCVNIDLINDTLVTSVYVYDPAGGGIKPAGYYCVMDPLPLPEQALTAPGGPFTFAPQGEQLPDRITPERVAAVQRHASYHVFPGTTLTVCCLRLANGWHVTGESACASPAFFDAEKGRQLALADAQRKVWALEGYLLREQLAAEVPY